MRSGRRAFIIAILVSLLPGLCALPGSALGADKAALARTEIIAEFIIHQKSDLIRQIFQVDTPVDSMIYITAPENRLVQLTGHTVTKSVSSTRYPSPSPDGRLIFFQGRETIVFPKNDANDLSREQKMNPLNLYQIYKLDMSTRKIQLISDGETLDSFPVAAPVGNRIAFCSKTPEATSRWQIAVMDYDGANREIIDGNIFTSYLSPSWSPDGKRLAYVSSKGHYDEQTKTFSPVTRLLIKDLDKKTTQTLPTMDVVLGNPSWSPRGDKIAFTVNDTESKSTSIWIINVDGSGMREITNGPSDNTATWLPGGTKLVFTRGKTFEDEHRKISTVDLTTGKITDLISAKNASLGFPRFYP